MRESERLPLKIITTEKRIKRDGIGRQGKKVIEQGRKSQIFIIRSKDSSEYRRKQCETREFNIKEVCE